MLSILVCHSYFLHLDHKQRARAKPYPPLATLQAAAMLRDAGHRVTLFDSMLAEDLEDYHRLLTKDRPQVVLFYEDTFNFLSKMCLSVMQRAACEMIAVAHGMGARVIVAGPDVSDRPHPYLAAGADLTLQGEGLGALMDLLPRLTSQPGARIDELAEGVPGVAFLRDDHVVTHPGAKVLPVAHYSGSAAWDLVDMDRYRSVWYEAHGYFSLNMVGSRGCSFRCTWCAKPTWGNLYLQREAKAVAAELVHLRKTYDPQHIWFADDIFGFRPEWVEEFTAAIDAAGGGIPFSIQTRADLISERMARVLKKAGCAEAWIGAESGSQRVLDDMNKGTTVAEILTARRRFQAEGIRVGFFIQLGYQGEDLEDILATRQLLQISRPDEIGVSVSYPLPGTKFYEGVKAQLGRKTHWQESDDLDMMFRGTFTSEFYRAVRDLLHDQVAMQGVSDQPSPALDERWRRLIDEQARYRSPGVSTSSNGLAANS
jgi:anaerobic magnesium-protoporphyrin IX monomethyl ester cyclase